MKSSPRSALGVVVCTGLAMLGLAFTGSTAAIASQASDPGPANTLPSAVPSAITPKVNDGKVYNIAQVGNTMIIGGSFTQVNSLSRTHLAAFDKTTGALSSFSPTIDGDVNSVLPGPTSTSVYIAGTFSNVNGTPSKLLALIDFTTGALVTSFHVPVINFGPVNDMVKSGNRLYIAGAFTKVGAKPHGGIASLNATTGALDPFMNVQFAGHHNDTGSGAQGAVGPWDLAITPDGNTLVVIGDFKTADTLLRDQVALIDTSVATAQVAPWATNRYAPYCFNWAFDSYVRGVAFSPDGSYFVINATGGGVGGTLCDATARFETNVSDSNAQPTWVDETGGDTVWGVTITSTAVFIGGHNRWINNPNGSDSPQAGALARPGLGALDPVSGRPFLWNPGRNPLGTAVYAMLATPEGLWIGSNTDWIGDRKYNRPKLAYFPYAGGYNPSATTTAGLPGTAYLGTSDAGGATNVLYRVDAGGPSIQSVDNGPDWAADSSDPSPVRNNGSNAAGWGPGETVDGTVPATTPNAVFESERWSPSDNPAMQWAFPVAAGLPLQVRLYFANRCTCSSTAGKRVFNVKLDGTTVLNHFDIVAAVGDQRGTMKAFNITSDGTVNIDFSHVTENPLINGIEIVRTDISPPPPGSGGLSTVAFDGSTGSQTSVDNQGVDFGNWRGAFLVGNKVFYGYATDSFLYSRTFVNQTFGPAVKIDPYNDPTWADVATGVGSTTFRGKVPSLYGQIPNLTGMVYNGGKVYYTVFGDSKLYSRWFTPDAGIMDERTFTSTSSVSFSDADGMFIAGGNLYYGSRSDGNLRSVSFSGGTVSGSATVVSGPGTDGVNWKNRAMFLGAAIPFNNPPTAAFTSNCGGFSCSFTSTSTDDNGIASYAWTFGDSGTASTANPSHTYANPGTYPVQLTVTDGGGKTDTVSHDVVASAPVSTISFVGSAHAPGGNVKTKTVTVPSAAQAGDTGVLFLSKASTATWSAPSGSGWTQVATHTSGTLVTTVWTKTLGASDPGSAVTFTSATAGHTSVDLAVYRGVNTATPVAAATQLGDGNQTSHVTPNAAAGSGDWVVSFWSDRSTATRAWTTPGSVTQRGATTDSGTVTMQDVIADTNGPVSSGAYGGITATTDAATARSDMWTIVLNTN